MHRLYELRDPDLARLGRAHRTDISRAALTLDDLSEGERIPVNDYRESAGLLICEFISTTTTRAFSGIPGNVRNISSKRCA